MSISAIWIYILVITLPTLRLQSCRQSESRQVGGYSTLHGWSSTNRQNPPCSKMAITFEPLIKFWKQLNRNYICLYLQIGYIYLLSHCLLSDCSHVGNLSVGKLEGIRWRCVPLIKKMTAHYNSQFCVTFHYCFHWEA